MTDPSAVVFLLMEEIGEVTLMRYGRVKDDGAPVEWDFVQHIRFDGIGGFSHILKQYEGYELKMPKGRALTPPPLGTRVRAIRDALEREKKSPTRPPVPWRTFERNAVAGIPKAVGYALLTEEESARVSVKPKPSLNSRVLWALDRALAPLLGAPHPTRLWLMPVNMRGTSRFADALVNPVAAIPVEFPDDASPEDVHRAVKRRFDESAHWGTWDLGRIRMMFGQRLMRAAVNAYYARPRYAWMGTFSNLGDWSVPGRAPKYFYVGVPPVTIAQPITAALMGWGGRLSLTVQAHAALGASEEDAMGWAREWKRLLLSVS